jgi:D-arabinose 1-dehydrogenase-like Zn-dependent alcohol dehydrogenase
MSARALGTTDAACRRCSRCSTTSASNNIVADVEVIPIQKINEAFERMLRQDVKYRFVIDMSSLK